MENKTIKLLSHNIPGVIPPHFKGVFAFRVRNVSMKTIHFHSHYAFYADENDAPKFQFRIFIDDQFFDEALVAEDGIKPKKNATIFFPFASNGKAELNLKIFLAEYDPSIPNQDICLLDRNMRVKDIFISNYLNAIYRIVFFDLYFLYIPLILKSFKLHYLAVLWFGDFFKKVRGYLKPFDIMDLKRLNRDLAFLEKQSRRMRARSFPSYLGIDTTSKCNLKCRSCFRRYSDAITKQDDMTAAEIDYLMEKLFPTAYTLNISTVGEPLLSPHMEKILEACTKYRVSLSLTTNGTLLEGERFLEKLGSVLNYIEISVDSASPALFEKMRSGASYEKVIRNAKNLGAIRKKRSDPKFSLGFSMTLFRDNLTEIPDVLRLVAEIGGNFLKTDIGVIFEKRDFHRSVLCVPDLYNEVHETAHAVAEKMGLRLLMRPPFSRGTTPQVHQKRGICDYLYLSACIGAQGKLNPCYFQVVSSCPVKKKGFQKCWNSKEMRKLRAEHDGNATNSHCRDCYLVVKGIDSLENRKKQFLKGEASNWGGIIDFTMKGNATQFKLDGWAEAEESFTWTVGHAASLKFRIYPPDSHRILLKIVMSAFLLPGIVNRQRVKVRVNQKQLSQWIFDKPGFHGMNLTMPTDLLLDSDYLRICFDVPTAVSPKEIGSSDDDRELGLAVQSIELAELPFVTN